MTISESLRTTGTAEVIVRLRPSRGRAPSSLPASLEKHFLPGMPRDAALLELLHTRPVPFSRGPESPPTTAAHIEASGPAAPVRFYPHLGLALGAIDRPGLVALRNEAAVEEIEAAPQLRLIHPVATTVIPDEGGPAWGLQALGVDKLHAQGLSGKGILVAHLDTGVDASHPALDCAVAEFAEFDAFGNHVGGARARDSHTHGTHTAGTISGRTIKGAKVGVAPGARLASAMVIEGGNVIARVLSGMNWAVGQRARVLSMSLGVIGTGGGLRVVTRILRASGMLPVIAIGNEGPLSSRYPGNYPEALSVGACDADERVADFSSSQRFRRRVDPIVPDLVGPGVHVVSCTPKGGYVAMSGTSMAAPHIAGLASLLMEAHPKKSIDEVEAAIFASARRLGDMTPQRANRGLPDGQRALEALAS